MRTRSSVRTYGMDAILCQNVSEKTLVAGQNEKQHDEADRRTQQPRDDVQHSRTSVATAVGGVQDPRHAPGPLDGRSAIQYFLSRFHCRLTSPWLVGGRDGQEPMNIC